MASSLEDLRILRAAEKLADEVWELTLRWDSYVKNVMGQQLCRATDSIGANIAEAFGRFHYGEKTRFLYYARGSLFETKYWLNRASARNLITENAKNDYAKQLNVIGRQLNHFVNQLKAQQRSAGSSNVVREAATSYSVNNEEPMHEFLTPDDLEWLAQPPPTNLQSPISNLQSHENH